MTNQEKNHQVPFINGTIHIVGIGGIGMSGIAEILHNLGYKVQGSDISENANIVRLKNLGIKIFNSQAKENIKDAAMIVISSAIKSDNKEVLAAKELNIPVVKRSEMLAEVMRLKYSVSIAGTHGKTTTTTMMATLFDSANLDPTVINGGIINNYNSNARIGKSDWLVAEADESDGTFLHIPSTIGVITNIDPEHLEYYGSFDNLKEAFRNFVRNLPFYGFAVLCIDNDHVRQIANNLTERKVITYGFAEDADVRATNIRETESGSIFDVTFSSKCKNGAKTIKDIELPIPGKHNISNSLAPIAVVAELGIEDEIITKGYKSYQGVKRRFTKVAEVNKILIIDDYGHHPTEIKTTLKTAKAVAQNRKGKVTAIFQPHRYSRVESLFEEFATCFKNADTVIVSPIYSAGEDPIEGISQETIIEAIKKHNNEVIKLNHEDDLPRLIEKNNNAGDVVIFLGAGTITLWANSLPEKLTKNAAA